MGMFVEVENIISEPYYNFQPYDITNTIISKSTKNYNNTYNCVLLLFKD